jgi:hypothetical protein
MWLWIIAPQLILFQYVSKFVARWAKLISLLLQIILIFSLYNYGAYVFIISNGPQPEGVFLLTPIWHYVIVATAGLVMKIIESY